MGRGIACGLYQRRDDMRRRGQIRVADAEADDIDTLRAERRPLPIQIGE
jgi:hypothetical protein